jgi:hypothetical protein
MSPIGQFCLMQMFSSWDKQDSEPRFVVRNENAVRNGIPDGLGKSTEYLREEKNKNRVEVLPKRER